MLIKALFSTFLILSSFAKDKVETKLSEAYIGYLLFTGRPTATLQKQKDSSGDFSYFIPESKKEAIQAYTSKDLNEIFVAYKQLQASLELAKKLSGTQEKQVAEENAFAKYKSVLEKVFYDMEKAHAGKDALHGQVVQYIQKVNAALEASRKDKTGINKLNREDLRAMSKDIAFFKSVLDHLNDRAHALQADQLLTDITVISDQTYASGKSAHSRN